MILEGRCAEETTEGPSVDTRWNHESRDGGRVRLRRRHGSRAERWGGLRVERDYTLIDKAKEETKGCRVRGVKSDYDVSGRSRG